MPNLSSFTESQTETLQRVGTTAADVASRTGRRVAGEVRGHRSEIQILLATSAFVVVVALLAVLLLRT